MKGQKIWKSLMALMLVVALFFSSAPASVFAQAEIEQPEGITGESTQTPELPGPPVEGQVTDDPAGTETEPDESDKADISANNITLLSASDIYVSGAGSDSNEGTEAAPFKTLDAALAAVLAGGTIHIMDVVPMSSGVVLNKSVTITGTNGSGTPYAGASLQRAATTARLLTVPTGVTLTLNNIALDGANYQINASSRTTGQLVYVSGGTLTLNSGAVLKNNFINNQYADYGSAILLAGGIVNINDGAEIRDNKLTGMYADGAAICIISGNGVVNMTGGLIIDNTASRMGNAVRWSSGTFNMTGGRIEAGSAPAASNGTFCFHGGALNMSGGASIDNVYIFTGKTINVTGALTGAFTGVTAANAAVGTPIVTASNVSWLNKAKFEDATGAFSVVLNNNRLELGLCVDYYVSNASGDDANSGTAARPYKTLNAALAAAPAGATIYIMDEVPVTSLTTITKPVTITGAGYANAALVRSVNGTMLQINSAVTMQDLALIEYSKNNSTPIGVQAGGVLTLNSGTLISGFESNYAPVFIFPNSGAKVIMNSGVVITGNKSKSNNASGAASGYVAAAGGGVFVGAGGTFTMNGGEISNNTNFNLGSGVYLQSNSTFNMNGGTIEGVNSGVSAHGSVCVFNGKFNLSGDASVDDVYLYAGQTINLASAFTGQPVSVTVQNGEAGTAVVTANDASWLNKAKFVDATGMFKIALLNNQLVLGAKGDLYVSNAGSDSNAGTEAKPFKTLQAAIAAADDGETIHIMDAVSVTATANISKAVSISGTGYPNAALIRAVNGSMLQIYNEVTISDLKLTDSTKHVNTPIGVQKDGVLTLESGTLMTGMESNYSPVFIYPNTGGKVVMNDGAAITGSVSKSNNMVGSAAGYVASGGGGVFVGAGGAFTMNGGEISSSVNFNLGSGVFVQNNATFTMNGGTIKGDSTYGSVCVYAGSFNMSGDATVENVYLFSGKTINLTGALTGQATGITANNNAEGTTVVTATNTAWLDEMKFVDMTNTFSIVLDTDHLELGTRMDFYVSNTTGADTNPGTEARPYKTLNAAIAAAPDNATIYIMDEVPVSVCVNVTKPLTITGAGFPGATLIRTVSGSMLQIFNEVSIADLKLTDTSKHINTPVGVQTGGVLTLESGALVTGMESNYAPVFIYPNTGGQVVMKSGAKITANSSKSNNTAVSATGYVASAGGGVYVGVGGKFTMNGGEISNNTSFRVGGGVFVQTNATFIMNNGTISAPAYNAVYVAGGTFGANGGTVVTAEANKGATFLATGAKISYPTVSGTVTKIEVADPPQEVGDTRIVSAAAGFTAWPANLTVVNEGKGPGQQGVGVIKDGYVTLSKLDDDATLKYVYRVAFVGETGLPGIGGNAAGTEPVAESMEVIIPFEQGAKQIAFRADVTKTTSSLATTVISGAVVNGAYNAQKLLNYNPELFAGGDTVAEVTYVVTAQDGTTKTYSLVFKRGMPQNLGDITLRVNFDTSALADAEAMIEMAVLAGDFADFSIVGDPNLSLANVDNKMELTAGVAYYITIKDATWDTVSASGRYTISQHVNTGLTLQYNGVTVANVTLVTTRVSVSEAAAVDDVVNIFNADDTFSDMYQDAADDLSPTSIKQNVTTRGEADDIVAQYATIAAEIALADFVTSGNQVTMDVYNNSGIKLKTKTVGAGTAKTLDLEIEPVEFVAAVAGTAAMPKGTDGYYRFNVTVTMGKQSVTNEITVPVIAHLYDGVSEEELNNALETAFSTALSGTVYVDADATDADIIAAIQAEMSDDIEAVVAGINITDVTCAVDGGITIKAATLPNGNYAASFMVKATKNTTDTTAAAQAALDMTIVYRPSVEDKVSDELQNVIEQALLGSLTFEDVSDTEDGAYRTQAKMEAYVLAKVQAVINGMGTTIQVNTKAPGETQDHFVNVDISDYNISPILTGKFVAPVAGSFENAKGTSGQYMFDLMVTIEKGEISNAVTPSITASANPVLASANGGSQTDNGVYIYQLEYQGVSLDMGADILAELFSGESPDVTVLEYDDRNDEELRLAAVQDWANALLMSASSVVVGSTTYTLENGVVTQKDGVAYAADLQLDLSSMVVVMLANGESIDAFTSTSSAASAANASNEYTVYLGSGLSEQAVDVTAEFAHNAGEVRGTISGGTAPYTMVLIDEDGQEHVIDVNPDGSYAIPPDLIGDFTVIITDGSNESSIATTISLPAAEAEQPQINLAPGSVVKGTVTNADSDPVDGATVLAPAEAGGDATTTTFSTGAYYLANVKIGAETIDVVASGIVNGNTATGVSARNTIPTSSSIDIVLQEGDMLRGDISPLVSGEVTVYNADGSVLSTTKINADGSYTLTGLSGTAPYAISASGNVENPDGSKTIMSGYKTNLSDFSDTTLPLNNGALLTGMAKNCQSFNEVSVTGKTSGEVLTADVAIHGFRYFVDQRIADTYTVSATGVTSLGEDGISVQSGALKAGEPQLNLDLPFEAGSRATGTVTLPSPEPGQPLPEYPVTITFVDKNTGETFTVVSDDTGNFDALLPAGEYDVFVSDKNNAYSAQSDFDNTAGTQGDLNVSLTYGSYVTGKVTLNGSAAAGAEVTTRAYDASMAETDVNVLTDALGVYRIANVVPGAVRSFVAVSGNASGAKTASIPAVGDVNIEMVTGMLVKNTNGIVTLVGGAPAAGATVAMTYNGKTVTGTVDSAGNFAVAGVPAEWAGKAVALNVYDSVGRSNTAQRNISAATDNVATINLQSGMQIRAEVEGSVVGGVALEDGTIVANATVKLYYGANLVATTTTDASGKFKLGNLPYNFYRIEVSAPVNDFDRVVTQTISLTAPELSATIVIPNQRYNTIVEQSGDVLPVVADIPWKIFQTAVSGNNSGFTQADLNVLNNNGSLLLRVVINPVSGANLTGDKKAILNAAGNGAAIADIWDISVYKEVTDALGNTTRTQLTSVPRDIVAQILVADAYQAKTEQLSAYRLHSNAAASLTSSFVKSGSGAYYVTITSQKFSTFALVHTAPKSTTPAAPITPYTGDVANGMLYAAILVLSGIAVALVAFGKKRKAAKR